MRALECIVPFAANSLSLLTPFHIQHTKPSMAMKVVGTYNNFKEVLAAYSVTVSHSPNEDAINTLKEILACSDKKVAENKARREAKAGTKRKKMTRAELIEENKSLQKRLKDIHDFVMESNNPALIAKYQSTFEGAGEEGAGEDAGEDAGFPGGNQATDLMSTSDGGNA